MGLKSRGPRWAGNIFTYIQAPLRIWSIDQIFHMIVWTLALILGNAFLIGEAEDFSRGAALNKGLLIPAPDILRAIKGMQIVSLDLGRTS